MPSWLAMRGLQHSAQKQLFHRIQQPVKETEKSVRY